MSTPNLLTCSPSELAEYLLEHRFSNEIRSTATFLLEATSQLPNAGELSAEMLVEEEEEPTSANLGERLAEPLEISMTAPRGKFVCTLYENGVHCVNAKMEGFTLLPDHASQLVIFPKPQDLVSYASKKKATNKMALLTLSDSHVTLRTKPLKQLCFPLPNDASWLENCRTSLNLTDNVIRISDSKFSSFSDNSTSSTTSGLPCVKAYHGVNDGHLFPLQEGLLFYKPPLFVPRSQLHSIACGRGASGNSRYVDMKITLSGEEGEEQEELEFSNIARHELTVLNDYIHKVLIPAMKADANDGNVANVEVDEESTEEETTSGRTGRQASRDARRATKAQMEDGDDGEEDDDEQEDWNAKASDSDQEEDDDELDEDGESEAWGSAADDDEDDAEAGKENEEEVFFDSDAGDDEETEDEDEGDGPVKKRQKQ